MKDELKTDLLKGELATVGLRFQWVDEDDLAKKEEERKQQAMKEDAEILNED